MGRSIHDYIPGEILTEHTSAVCCVFWEFSEEKYME